MKLRLLRATEKNDFDGSPAEVRGEG